MSHNTRIMDATPQQVWDVLADGWLYPLWVVGASRMREVDDTWPEVGSRIHHSVGVWPILVDDHTEVVDAAPGTSLDLRARAWPTGEAAVHLRLTPSADGTEVRIDEDVVAGPGALAPRPLRHLSINWRNTETLRRLAFIAERRR